jgi:hypothetical protein
VGFDDARLNADGARRPTKRFIPQRPPPIDIAKEKQNRHCPTT